MSAVPRTVFLPVTVNLCIPLTAAVPTDMRVFLVPISHRQFVGSLLYGTVCFKVKFSLCGGLQTVTELQYKEALELA